MPHIDLPVGVPGIRSAFNFRPLTAGPLLELAEALLRADNTLSRGERELIAAYVSHLNECYYCETSHSTFAGLQLEGGARLVEQVKRDPEQAAISEKLRGCLRSPRRCSQVDVRSPRQTSPPRAPRARPTPRFTTLC